LLHESINLISPLKRKNNITIETNLNDCPNLSVIVNNTAIKQVFINLITNAIKYNKQNGNITINCERENFFAIIK